MNKLVVKKYEAMKKKIIDEYHADKITLAETYRRLREVNAIAKLKQKKKKQLRTED